MKHIIASCAFTLLLAIFSPNLYGAEPSLELGVIKPKVRVKAPAFTLTSLNRGEFALTDFKGKLILLNFWATWCAPCKDEMGGMEKLWLRLKENDFVIIAVAEDRGNPKAVRRFSKEHNITFPVLLDPTGRARRAYEVVGLPTSYIIGKDGKISGKVIGARVWDGIESLKFFESLLDKKSD
jgi:peroxiredoxin